MGLRESTHDSFGLILRWLTNKSERLYTGGASGVNGGDGGFGDRARANRLKISEASSLGSVTGWGE